VSTICQLSVLFVYYLSTILSFLVSTICQPSILFVNCLLPATHTHIHAYTNIYVYQLRLHDGTRLTQRFNLTHTVGDIYALVASGA
jgi:hypothetical protein